MSDSDSFVMVDRVPEPVAEEMSVWWENWCYGENSHLGLGGEAVFIAGAVVIATAEAATRVVKTTLGS